MPGPADPMIGVLAPGVGTFREGSIPMDNGSSFGTSSSIVCSGGFARIWNEPPPASLRPTQLGLSLTVPAADPELAFTGERYIPAITGEIELEHLHRYTLAAPLCCGKDVLDIACGDGYGSYILAQVAKSVCGVDIDAPTIAYAKKRYVAANLGFAIGSCTEIPIADHSVDIVVSFETIEHITNHADFLKEVKRVLRADGLLLVSTPDKDVYNAQIPSANPFHLKEMRKGEFESVLREHFGNVLLSGQRTLFASAIISEASALQESPPPLVFATEDQHHRITVAERPVAGTYLLALCSDGDLPSPQNSLFEGVIKSNAFSALKGGISERDQRIIQLTNQVGEIGALRDQLAARESVCSRVEQALATADLELGHVQAQLRNRDQEVVQLQSQLSTHEGQIQTIRERLSHSESDSSRLQKQLAARERGMNTLQEQLASSDEAVNGLQEQLAERQTALKQLQERLELRDRDVIDLTNQLQSRHNDISYIRNQLAARNEEMGQLQNRLQAREQDVTHEQDRFANLGSQLAEVQDRLASCKREGVQLQALLATRQREIDQSQSILARRDGECSHLRSELSQVHDRLGAMLNSQSWRITRPLRWVRTNCSRLAAPPRRLVRVVRRSQEKLWLRTPRQRALGRALEASGLFDAAYYVRQYPDVIASGLDPVAHFVLRGAAAGHNPNPLFDTGYYLRQNPAVAAAGVNPLWHYLTVGAAQGQDPNPLFDTSYYVGKYPDVRVPGINPLVHFLNIGAAEGRKPNPLFDTAYYLHRHPQVAAAGVNPLAHYLEDGARTGCDPNPLFDTAFYLRHNPQVAAVGANPLAHYLMAGAAENRDPHPLFATAYYRQQHPELAAAQLNPLIHFLETGAADGLDPNPLFDSSFYLGRYADVAATGVNPLAHYLTAGCAEGRDPNPLFHTSYYLEHYPDVAAAGINPLVHYLTVGGVEGRDPNPLFQSSFYLQQNPEVAAAGVNPLVHFLACGASAGRDPNPVFDTSYYRERYPDVAAAGVNPLTHYLQIGAAEGRHPNPLFDSAFYSKHYADVAAAGLNPLAHYLAFGIAEGRDPNPLFDTSYYLEQYADVAAAGIHPLVHYLQSGAAEGRDPNPLFDSSYYLERYSDVAAANVNPLVHYLSTGAAEGRQPNPLFDSGYYLRQNPEVARAGMNPLVHFQAAGAAEGRDPNPLFDTSYYLQENTDVAAAQVNPLVHYLTRGVTEGRHPNPLFDTAYYLHTYPEVAASGINPLAHFLEMGATQELDPNPLFDTSYYLQQYSDVRASGTNPLAHYLTVGARMGYNPSALFDTTFYQYQYPEVVAAGMNPLYHYLSQARIHKHLMPGLSFDPTFYLEWNREAAEASVAPLVHYLMHFVHPDASQSQDRALAALVNDINQAEPGNLAVADAAPQVTIIIPAYNQIRYTLECIRSVRQQSTEFSYEVLVVDDCSTDETPAILPQLAGVRYLQNGINRGFLRSCNHAAKQARGEYLVFLNNDTRVLAGWLDELIGTFNAVPEAGLVGSKLVFPTGLLQEAGGLIWQDGSAWNLGRGADRRRPDFNYLRNADYCSGASIALPRALWQQLGGFDNHFAPAYYEDADLAFRVREAGFKVVYQPLSVLVHFEGITSGTDLSTGTKAYQVANQRKFFLRWRHRLVEHAPPGVEPQRERDRGAVGRILVIDHITPEPDQDAGSVVALELMKAFRDLGFKVTFFPDNLAFMPRYTPPLQRLGFECLYPPFEPSIAEHLKGRGTCYDAICMIRAPIAVKHLDAVRSYAPQAKFLLHVCDLHFLREQRQAALENNSQQAQALARTKARELSLMVQADCTIVLSTHEKEVLAAELPHANVYMCPYILDVAGCKAPFEERQDIMFIGGYGHPPNVDAVLHFVRDIFPLIKAQLPDLKFYAIGNRPPQEIRDLARKDVIITGHVPDLTEFFNRCRLSIAPLRYGAGVKGKVALSLSHGVPCVASTLAAEGMLLTAGHDILVADDPDAFAAAVVRLYTDGHLWNAMSRRGMDFIERTYSTKRGQERVQEMLASVGLATEAIKPRNPGLKLLAA
jgi:GT2 family glycosyltransferase/SAM-dependent methyltransferase/glycosyltransferase involved in cell wall biosynthesis/predicted  nucleic acid-binding Zn-ribbon protein